MRLPTDSDGGSEEDNADAGVEDPVCGGFTVGSSSVVVSRPDDPANGLLGDTVLVIVEIITVDTPLFVWVVVEVRRVGVGLGAGEIDHVLVIADGLPRFDNGRPEGVLDGNYHTSQSRDDDHRRPAIDILSCRRRNESDGRNRDICSR